MPRQWAANAGFTYIVDGSIGASARTFSAIAVNAIPGASSAAALWRYKPAAKVFRVCVDACCGTG